MFRSTKGIQSFTFDEEAEKLLNERNSIFISSINEAVRQGNVPPHSKTVDLFVRVAVALHCFSYVAETLLGGSEPNQLSPVVGKEILERAIKLVEYSTCQKEIFTEFVGELTRGNTQKEKRQPSQADVRNGILLFPGPVVIARSFRQSGPNRCRGITDVEFTSAVEDLELYGKCVFVRIPRVPKRTVVFIKKDPETIIGLQAILCVHLRSFN